MKKFLAILLSPFTLLYGMGVSLHQALYLSGFFKPSRFSIPIINIGNISVGGTGKSPHIEYIIRLLKDYVHVGVISRGYKRKTVGYLNVENTHTANDVGDEPLQMKIKFPNVHFAVSENRAIGIPKLLSDYPDTRTILMDDGFQHLQVSAGLNILLTEYKNPYSDDYLMPSGRLREWKHGANRAQIIVITKCPHEPSENEIVVWKKKLNIKSNQDLFFSTMQYGIPYSILNPENKFHLNPSIHIILISAIANSDYLVDYLEPQVGSITNISYEDHHYFKENEIIQLLNRYNSIFHSNKIILTTEKDATRLRLFKETFEKNQVSIYAIPIEIHFYEKKKFDEYIRNFLLEFKI